MARQFKKLGMGGDKSLSADEHAEGEIALSPSALEFHLPLNLGSAAALSGYLTNLLFSTENTLALFNSRPIVFSIGLFVGFLPSISSLLIYIRSKLRANEALRASRDEIVRERERQKYIGDSLIGSIDVIYTTLVRDWLRVPADRAQLRITVFLSDSETKELRQVVRRDWKGRCEVSRTVVRWGTGVVGLSYVRQTLVDLNVDNGKAFADTVRLLGIPPEESGNHNRQDARYFAAVPVFEGDDQAPYDKKTMTYGRVAAVVSIDALVTHPFKPRWHIDIANSILPSIRNTLVGVVRA